MKRLFAAALLSVCWPALAAIPAAPVSIPADAIWPAWQNFAEAFVQDDGRVVDWTADARTVSEGQGYALFFALVANDRARFERILAWTES
ncbi:MAG: cellulase, partial [Nevskia sp.]|nr:cellulase [Nevskia sp.]